MHFQPNNGKNLDISVDGVTYQRFPVKTSLVSEGDSILELVQTFALPFMIAQDTLFISERVVAIAQGRSYPIKDIHPGRLAKFLVRFVHKSPYGIGLGSPWTMELAVREAGAVRMLFAAAVAAVTKPFGIRGMFYRVVGHNINAIDGPCDYTLPPYNHYAKLGPKNPDKVAREISVTIGFPVAIVDANDLGLVVLGRSTSQITDDFCKKVFRDNPLGQSDEQTPLAIIRKM